MKDIKKHMKIENRIIDSILKDEVDKLPTLLQDLIPSMQKNKENKNSNFNLNASSSKNECENEYFNYNNNNVNDSNSNNYNSYSHNNNKPNFLYNKFQNQNWNLNSNNIQNRNDIKAYGIDAEQIAQRANRLVNLNFLVSSGRKRRENNLGNVHSKINYNQFFMDSSSLEYVYYSKSSGKRSN